MEKNCSSFSQQSYAKRDQNTVWHPFTNQLTAQKPIVIIKGKGSYLYSEDGLSYLDGISSWWVNLHGHSNPFIIKKIHEQAKKLEQVIFAGFTHPKAIELAEKLLQILPMPMSKVFYSDNGSTAVEVALKMVLQYFYNKNSKTKRKKIICFNQGYHGDTFGAMSAASKSPFTRPFWSHFFDVKSIDPPFFGKEKKSISQLKIHLKDKDVAGFIFEPLILGSGGMLIYPPHGLNELIKLCKNDGVLTIADEVMTGFGRTGTLFASEKVQEPPDIICLSKGITGGFLPLGATICNQTIFNAFLSEKPSNAFLHGHSYTANPLASAAALASIDLLLKKNCQKQRKNIENCHLEFCKSFKNHPKLKRCEALGTILVLEYSSKEGSSYFHSLRDKLYNHFITNKILLRPLGNTLYVLPPYCITSEELKSIYSQIIITLELF